MATILEYWCYLEPGWCGPRAERRAVSQPVRQRCRCTRFAAGARHAACRAAVATGKHVEFSTGQHDYRLAPILCFATDSVNRWEAGTSPRRRRLLGPATDVVVLANYKCRAAGYVLSCRCRSCFAFFGLSHLRLKHGLTAAGGQEAPESWIWTAALPSRRSEILALVDFARESGLDPSRI